MDDENWIVLRAPSTGTGSDGSSRMSPDDAASVVVTAESLPASAIADLVADPTTYAAAPDMPTSLIRPFAGTPSTPAVSWGLAASGADVCVYDGAGVRVAILDTGIDAGHPCFVGVDLVERDFSGDGNGDVAGHGTHCAGTLFGRDRADRIGVARGVTDALIGKVLGDAGRGTAMMAIRGIQWAADEGANIVSMSLGLDSATYVEDLIARGWEPRLAASRGLDAYRRAIRLFDRQLALLAARSDYGPGVMVVAATGNESDRARHPDFRVHASLPAAADGVVSVGAVGSSAAGMAVADFSNSLPTVCGPGVDVRSAWPGGGFATLSGTSMACPHVAGIAALWWQSLGAEATADLVTLRLKASAGHSGFAAGFNHTDVGLGLVRAP